MIREKPKNKIIPLSQLQDLDYLYLDLELFPVSSETADLIFSVQFAEIPFRNVLENSRPTLYVIYGKSYRTEREKLQRFFPYFKRLMLPQKSKDFLVATGYFVENDLNLLKAKYSNLGHRNRDLLKFENNIRKIDLLPFSIQSTGLLDPSLSTAVNYTDLKTEPDRPGGDRIKNLMLSMENNNYENKEEEKEFLEYIGDEFAEIFKLFRYHFNKDYKNQRTEKQNKIIKRQQFKSSRKYFRKKESNG
jgi:hypothetical protein